MQIYHFSMVWTDRGWIFCSLLVARYFLLVARYVLLVARYFLLVARYFSLVARYFLLVARYSLLVTFSQLLWVIAQLLITRVTPIYLEDEFFVFSFLVLLKEMRTLGESKISSGCFCVSCKSSELGCRRGPRFPC